MSLTFSKADDLALSGLQCSARNNSDFERFLDWMQRFPSAMVSATVDSLRAKHKRPAGLSIIISNNSCKLPSSLLADLSRQEGMLDRFEVLLIDHSCFGDAQVPDVPFRMSCHKSQSTYRAAWMAVLDQAAYSYIMILKDTHRVSSGFVSSVLSACGPNTITLARTGSTTVKNKAINALKICEDLNFRSSDLLTSEHAIALAPLLLSDIPKAFPAVYSHFVPFRETASTDFIFWTEVIGVFHPVLRIAGKSGVVFQNDEAPKDMPDAGALLESAAMLQQIEKCHPHPVMAKAQQTLAKQIRSCLVGRPDRIVSAVADARRLGLNSHCADTIFDDLCIAASHPREDPKISVIVPVHNTGPYLRRCLESILAQTMSNFELLVVDDASTDDSLDIMIDYARRDPRIRVYTHAAPRGPGGARNTALRNAQGRYVSFIDSDDRVEEAFLEKLWDGTSSERYDIVVCGAARTSQEGVIIGCIDTDVRRLDPVPQENILTLLTPALWNKLWRRSLFSGQASFFPEGTYFQDAARVPGLVAKAKAINRIGTVLYSYTERNGNITTGLSDRHLMDYLRLFDEIKNSLAVSGKYSENKENFQNWMVANINYHLKSLSERSAEEETFSYSRHLRLIQMGYQNFDDGLRSEKTEIPLDTMMRHSGLI